MTVEDRVLSVVRSNMEKKAEVALQTDLKNDLCLDSFGILMIINALEEEFSIAINENDFGDIATVKDIADKLKLKLS